MQLDVAGDSRLLSIEDLLHFPGDDAEREEEKEAGKEDGEEDEEVDARLILQRRKVVVVLSAFEKSSKF